MIITHRYDITSYEYSRKVEERHRIDSGDWISRVLKSARHWHENPIGCGYKYCEFCDIKAERDK